MITFIKNRPAFIVFALSFIYLVILCAKSYTWVFASEDATNWLTVSQVWMTAQPMGSPIYVFLGHLVTLFPGDEALLMTVFLSCFPAAVAVALTFAIVRQLTGRAIYGLSSALILLASIGFITQSTIVEEYALASMFVTMAIYFKVKGKEKLTWMALGFASGVHFLVAVGSLVWFLVELRQWKRNLKAMPIYLACGLLPYAYVLVMMAMDTPRWNSGPLTLQSAQDYFGGPGGRITGALSVWEFPKRFGMVLGLMFAYLGFALIPFFKGVRQKFTGKWLILTMIVFLVVYYLTSLDAHNWVFWTMIMPGVCIIAGYGLSKLKMAHLKIVSVGAFALLCCNSYFFNADILTDKHPIAQEVYDELMAMPDGSVVVGHPRYSLVAIYCRAEGRDLIPLLPPYIDEEEKFDGYMNYIKSEFNLRGNTSAEMIQSAWEDGREVYFAGVDRDPISKEIQSWLELEGSGVVQKVIGITGCLSQESSPAMYSAISSCQTPNPGR